MNRYLAILACAAFIFISPVRFAHAEAKTVCMDDAQVMAYVTQTGIISLARQFKECAKFPALQADAEALQASFRQKMQPLLEKNNQILLPAFTKIYGSKDVEALRSYIATSVKEERIDQAHCTGFLEGAKKNPDFMGVDKVAEKMGPMARLAVPKCP